jgi:5-methylcytosine-specific restriction endonuclease McrA
MRPSYKVDFPPEWNKRRKAGLCPVCAKPKEEFEKGRQVYCSAKCADAYSDHFITWTDLRKKMIDKNPKCEECGITEEKWKEKKAGERVKFFAELDGKYEKEITAIKAQMLKELEERTLQAIERIERLTSTNIQFEQHLESLGVTIPNKYEYFPGFEVDHKVALMNGGDQWDEKNLRVLCHDCHLKKTRHDHREKKVDAIHNTRLNDE